MGGDASRDLVPRDRTVREWKDPAGSPEELAARMTAPGNSLPRGCNFYKTFPQFKDCPPSLVHL